MGAVETMMIDCAYNEIGKYLGMPTQAYIALSDAKLLDGQAGLETSMGATLPFSPVSTTYRDRA